MFRKEIKVVDCTVRDGGLMNNWKFSDDFVKAIYEACVAAGVDYMEIGYKSSEHAYSRDNNGCWKFCDEQDLRRIVGDNNTDLKLSAMADIGRIDYDDIAPADDSVIDMIRVACYAHQVDKGVALAHHCMDKGYEVTINLMAVSKVMERDLDEALKDVAESRVPIFYIVDSFGSMYCEQVESLAKKYHAALPGKTIGFHGHNNMQLGFANTIEAIIHNCNMLDGSIMGIGRGAGNCPLELLLAFLKNPKYKLRPVLKVLEEQLKPLAETIEWGYHMPYMISGMLNEHPRTSLKYMDTAPKERGSYVDFYEQMMSMHELE